MIKEWIWKVVAGIVLLTATFVGGIAYENLHWQKRWDDQQSVYASSAAAAKAQHDQEIADARSHNEAVEAALEATTAERDRARSDSDLARRLLDAARPANCGGVPKATNQPAAPPAGGTSSGAGLESTLTAAIGECERNADRLDALIAELRPQL